MAAFERSVARAPDRPIGWTNLGAALAAVGRLDSAIDATTRAAMMDPSRAVAWTNLVRYLAAAGRLDDARRALGAAARAGVHDSALDALRRELDAARAPDERDQAAPAATPN